MLKIIYFSMMWGTVFFLMFFLMTFIGILLQGPEIDLSRAIELDAFAKSAFSGLILSAIIIAAFWIFIVLPVYLIGRSSHGDGAE